MDHGFLPGRTKKVVADSREESRTRKSKSSHWVVKEPRGRQEGRLYQGAGFWRTRLRYVISGRDKVQGLSTGMDDKSYLKPGNQP